MKLTSRGWLIALAAVAISALASHAEIPRTGPPPQDSLQAVLDRIHDHSANDAWKQGGFKDDAIEKWLDKLVGSVAKAAAFPELKLPVRLSDVRPGDPKAGRQLRSTLIIGSDIKFKDVSVHDSIVLADGSVEASRVENSVIVARGAITISMSSASSVIVSGAYVKSGQYDGKPRDTTNGSLIVSRGWADLGTAYGTLIAAPEGIRIGRTDSAIFINAELPMPAVGLGGIAIPRDNGSRSVKVPDLPLEPLPVHSLAARITVTGVLHGERSEVNDLGRLQQAFGPRGIIFRLDEREHLAELHEPIVDEDGRPVESLRNWRLGHIGAKFALLIGPESNAVVRLEKQP